VNIKRAFAKYHGCKPCGMDKAMRHAGLKLEGTHHRGIDDARNIARLLELTLAREKAASKAQSQERMRESF
jgi:inhibitor of KinA sporulation pathway (predicted exonuclease)